MIAHPGLTMASPLHGLLAIDRVILDKHRAVPGSLNRYAEGELNHDDVTLVSMEIQ